VEVVTVGESEFELSRCPCSDFSDISDIKEILGNGLTTNASKEDLTWMIMAEW
jgi:hypothetical protein